MNARLNHGRWVVNCSSDDCEAVLFADRAACECRDESVCEHPAVPCGALIEATFPPRRADIDRLLNSRSRPNRNWSPGEKLADLKRENLLHGVGI